ncbi:GntR family transcriptional regulator, partial [Burkholderia multivorans]
DDRGQQAVEEMREILAGIAAGDARAAREAAVAHVARVAEIARKLLTQGRESAAWRQAG